MASNEARPNPKDLFEEIKDALQNAGQFELLGKLEVLGEFIGFLNGERQAHIAFLKYLGITREQFEDFKRSHAPR